MKASKTLPEAYHLYRRLILSSKMMVISLNVAGILLLFVFGWLFMGVAAALNPYFFVLSLSVFTRSIDLAEFIFIMLAVVVLHEGSHALFFWLFTGERPKISFNFLYASAAAPGWYFPRLTFIVIGGAPLFFISLAGLLMMPFTSVMTVPWLVLALTVNAAGSIGDIITIAWLLVQPGDTLVQDEGMAVNLFRAYG